MGGFRVEKMSTFCSALGARIRRIFSTQNPRTFHALFTHLFCCLAAVPVFPSALAGQTRRAPCPRGSASKPINFHMDCLPNQSSILFEALVFPRSLLSQIHTHRNHKVPTNRKGNGPGKSEDVLVTPESMCMWIQIHQHHNEGTLGG